MRSIIKRKSRLGKGKGLKEFKLNRGKGSFKKDKPKYGLRKSQLPPKKYNPRKPTITLLQPTKTKVE